MSAIQWMKYWLIDQYQFVKYYVFLIYTNHTKIQYKFKKYGTRKINENDTLNDIVK